MIMATVYSGNLPQIIMILHLEFILSGITLLKEEYNSTYQTALMKKRKVAQMVSCVICVIVYAEILKPDLLEQTTDKPPSICLY